MNVITKNKTIMKNGIFVVFLVLSVQLSAVTGQTKRNRPPKPKVQTATVAITQQGYQPVSLKLRRGVPVRITFLRTTDATCAKEIVIPAYGVNRSLPLNEAVVVRFTPKTSGAIGFTCGMNMMRGTLVVQ